MENSLNEDFRGDVHPAGVYSHLNARSGTVFIQVNLLRGLMSLPDQKQQEDRNIWRHTVPTPK